MTKILLLEDDFKLAREIKSFLKQQAFECEIVYDGSLFMRQSKLDEFNLYILDINVPSLNGLEVCKLIRKTDKQSPILMLTAFSDVEDKVSALSFGADDYLVKPFHFDELNARIMALLRRSQNPQSDLDEVIEIDDLNINCSTMTVMRNNNIINLTPKEYKLLLLLARAKGRPVSKLTISEKVWDINFETGTNTIEVYINFLRNKIDKGQKNKLIHTRPGFGYFLNPDPS
jgi:DNA-binding response OmpR family regulator